MSEINLASTKKAGKINWWLVAVGAVLLLGEAKTWLLPRSVPDELKPSNETQMGGFFLASALICIIGILFVVAGLRKLWIDSSDKPTE